MTLENISEAFERTDAPPQDFTNVSTIWNGKDVKNLSTKPDAWLVFKIPFNPETPFPSLEKKVSSVNSRNPTVEQVLERHNLTFASSKLGQREVEQLKTTDYGWLIIPLLTSTASSLEGKVEIDSNDHRIIEKVLERQGWFFLPSPDADPFFAMQTIWV